MKVTPLLLTAVLTANLITIYGPTLSLGQDRRRSSQQSREQQEQIRRAEEARRRVQEENLRRAQEQQRQAEEARRKQQEEQKRLEERRRQQAEEEYRRLQARKEELRAPKREDLIQRRATEIYRDKLNSDPRVISLETGPSATRHYLTTIKLQLWEESLRQAREEIERSERSGRARSR